MYNIRQFSIAIFPLLLPANGEPQRSVTVHDGFLAFDVPISER